MDQDTWPDEVAREVITAGLFSIAVDADLLS